MTRQPIWQMITRLAAALGVLALVRAAPAHPGLSVSLKISISDEEVAYDVLMSADFVRQLAQKQSVTLPKPVFKNDAWVLESDAEVAAAQSAVEALLAGVAEVNVDDLVVPPVYRSATFTAAMVPGAGGRAMEMFPPDIRCAVAFPTKGRPERVGLTWRLYPEDPMRATFDLPPQTEVVAELDAYDENKLIVFTFDEPEYVWHAPTAPPEKRVWPVLAEARPPRIRVPLLSTGLVALWLLTLLTAVAVKPLRKRLPPIALAGVVVLGAGALTFRQFVWEVESPWTRRVRTPTSEEAAKLLETLQRNIYRAFEYKTESDVYDVLAQSVDGPLLDDVYNEVHQSLILRDQGGAVARIKQVDINGIDVFSSGVQPDGRIAVQLSSTWQVVGAVFHWGHVHTRTNEYNALFTIATHDQQWRITAIEVMSQKRIIKDGDDPLPPTLERPKPPEPS